MAFARWTFLIAGILGLIVMPPHYFLEDMIGRDHPPAITHPEYYYGYFGVGIMWQLAFVIIAFDPVRYRPLMIPGMLEKIAFGTAMIALYAYGRIPYTMAVAGGGDLVLAALFFIAWRKAGDVSLATRVAEALAQTSAAANAKPAPISYNEPHGAGDRDARPHALVR